MKKKIKDLTLKDLTKVEGLCYTPLDILLSGETDTESFLLEYGEMEIEIDESNND